MFIYNFYIFTFNFFIFIFIFIYWLIDIFIDWWLIDWLIDLLINWLIRRCRSQSSLEDMDNQISTFTRLSTDSRFLTFFMSLYGKSSLEGLYLKNETMHEKSIDWFSLILLTFLNFVGVKKAQCSSTRDGRVRFFSIIHSLFFKDKFSSFLVF